MKSRAVAFCVLLFMLWCNSGCGISVKDEKENNAIATIVPAWTHKVIIKTSRTIQNPTTTKAPTTSSSKSNSSKTTNQTTLIPASKITCEMRNGSCARCLDDNDCFYCDNERSCAEKTDNFIPPGCEGNDWYWKQCEVRDEIIFIVFPTIGVILGLVIICCLYHCLWSSCHPCCHRRCQNCPCCFKICMRCTDDKADLETLISVPNEETSSTSTHEAYIASTNSDAVQDNDHVHVFVHVAQKTSEMNNLAAINNGYTSDS
ncbi:uncharacterized protein LOC114522694 [Dendronephthya gigantea]|uniref:uncharacterized protein LOC114522694 n=1 Tax=Dendronephthya gigantea TaxID=151771 RepID=UPI00106B3D1E|nr:uncharacterized protein LOC114522694 [Dendronephthya gigantea]